MQNFGGIQQNINDVHQMNMQIPYGFPQMRSGQEFPVPITATQNAALPQRKRTNKKHPAPQPPPQPHMRMMQQQNQLQQFQQPPQAAPPPMQQIDQMGQMGQISQMGSTNIGQIPQPQMPQQMQQQMNQKMAKPQQMRQIPPNIKAQQSQQQKIDPNIFFYFSQTLCSFSLMDSIEFDWIGPKVNPEIVDCVNNADDDETDLDFNSVQDYINISNNSFEQK